MIKRSFIREILEAITPETISFAGGLPDETLFPTHALAESAAAVLQTSRALQYSVTQGDPSLRASIARRYSRNGLPTDADEILVTTGSQQAITLAALAHFSNGVLAENPLYLGAKGIFDYFKIKTQSIALDVSRIDAEALDRLGKPGSWAYLIPDFHNPTGRRYDLATRKEVAKRIEANGMMLAEDAPYEALYFDRPMPSITSMIPERSLHMGSFSKILAPGLRVGWVRASKEVIAPMVAIKERIDLHSSALDQAIIDHYLRHYDLEAHLQTIRSAYQAKMEMMAEVMEKVLPEFRFRRPEGGMFIYGSFDGIDASVLVRECIKEGVVFVPGTEFADPDIGSARFNFSHADPKRIERGVGIIRRVIDTKR